MDPRRPRRRTQAVAPPPGGRATNTGAGDTATGNGGSAGLASNGSGVAGAGSGGSVDAGLGGSVVTGSGGSLVTGTAGDASVDAAGATGGAGGALAGAPGPFAGTTSIFDGRTLNGWEQGTAKLFSVVDRVIDGKGTTAGQLLITQADYGDFRIAVSSNMVAVGGTDHLGICFWGGRTPVGEYNGRTLIIPPGGNTWDYSLGTGLKGRLVPPVRSEGGVSGPGLWTVGPLGSLR